MVTPDDHVGATKVLAEDTVEQAFARSAVAHIERVATHDHSVLDEVILDEGLDALDANVGRDVTGLQVADQLMNVQSVADLDGNLRQVLVRSVHGIAQLKRRYGFPALLLEDLPTLRRPLVGACKLRREVALRENLDRPGDVPFLLIHHHLDARVFGVVGGEDALALELLVDLVRLGHLHGAHDLCRLSRHERDIRPRSDLFILRHRDRYGPEGACRHLHRLAHALPVVLTHEAFEGRITADTQHDEIAGFARRQLQLRKGLSPFQFLFLLPTFEEKNLQLLTAVRGYHFSRLR